MRLVWHGTASIEITGENGRLLFDPFVPLRGSSVQVTIDDYDGFTDIFVTHGHFDHISSLPEIVKRNPDVNIYCTDTPYHTLMKKGIQGKNLNLLHYGDTIQIRGFTIQVIHGKHAILPKSGLWRLRYMLQSKARRNLPHIVRENRICIENDETVFYQIQAEDKTVSLMGSMNLRDDANYPTGSDLLILPYNGWEDNYPPAVTTIERLQPKRVALDHYDDTFPPVTMPLDLKPIQEKYGEMIFPLELGKVVDV